MVSLICEIEKKKKKGKLIETESGMAVAQDLEGDLSQRVKIFSVVHLKSAKSVDLKHSHTHTQK